MCANVLLFVTSTTSNCQPEKRYTALKRVKKQEAEKRKREKSVGEKENGVDTTCKVQQREHLQASSSSHSHSYSHSDALSTALAVQHALLLVTAVHEHTLVEHAAAGAVRPLKAHVVERSAAGGGCARRLVVAHGLLPADHVLAAAVLLLVSHLHTVAGASREQCQQHVDSADECVCALNSAVAGRAGKRGGAAGLLVTHTALLARCALAGRVNGAGVARLAGVKACATGGALCGAKGGGLLHTGSGCVARRLRALAGESRSTPVVEAGQGEAATARTLRLEVDTLLCCEACEVVGRGGVACGAAELRARAVGVRLALVHNGSTHTAPAAVASACGNVAAVVRVVQAHTSALALDVRNPAAEAVARHGAHVLLPARDGGAARRRCRAGPAQQPLWCARCRRLHKPKRAGGVLQAAVHVCRRDRREQC